MGLLNPCNHLIALIDYLMTFFPIVGCGLPGGNGAIYPKTGLFGDGMPKVDIIDRDNEVFVRADLPGIKKDDLDATLTDSCLTISGHCDEHKEEESGDYYSHETRHGDFSRTLNLPAEVNGDKVEAVFNHGILELTMPKVKQCKRKTVKVQ